MINPTLARDFTQAAGYRAIGTTDDVTTCELCGKSGLASTVIIEFTDENGEGDGEAYLGSDCAARKIAGRTDRKLAGKILQQAKGANLKRANAVANSRRFFDYYQPFIDRQENPQAREDRGCYIREYSRCNPVPQHLLGQVSHYDEAMEAVARHREIVATDGRSAL